MFDPVQCKFCITLKRRASFCDSSGQNAQIAPNCIKTYNISIQFNKTVEESDFQFLKIKRNQNPVISIYNN